MIPACFPLKLLQRVLRVRIHYEPFGKSDGLKDFVMQVLRERRQLGLKNIPIYLSEWNNTPSQQDLLNDTCFKSCYIVKNILENYDRLESFTYQALTDLMSDGPLPDKLFFGGLGLFTVNQIPQSELSCIFTIK